MAFENKLNSKDKIADAIDDKILNNEEQALKQLNTIISKLPIELKQLFHEAFKYKRISIEYLLSSVLFAYSNSAGLAFNIECMNYVNYANLYFVIVGSRGDVKSPAMDLATKPLNDYDDNQYSIYQNEIKENNESENSAESDSINRKQLFLQDATIEAAQYVHSKNPYSLGIFIDELLFLIEKMSNKNSNEGAAWRTFLLQGSTNKHIDIARKTTTSYRLKKSYPTLLGSTQTQFIPKMFANGNLESGLIDRLLFTTKLTHNDKLSRGKITPLTIEKYSQSITKLMDLRMSIENNVDEDVPNSLNIQLSIEGENRIFEYSQELIDRQKELVDETNQYMSKMQINIHKITLLVHLILRSSENNIQSKITLECVELAILINEFYFTNFKIVLKQKDSNVDEKMLVNEIIKLAKENNIEQKSIVTLTGRSKGSISKLWNKNN